MDDCLVVGLDRSCVVKNYDLGFEIVDRLRLSILVYQNHSLAEIVSLELLLLNLGLNSEADSLTSECFFYCNSLVMDSFNFNGTELALLIRS